LKYSNNKACNRLVILKALYFLLYVLLLKKSKSTERIMRVQLLFIIVTGVHTVESSNQPKVLSEFHELLSRPSLKYMVEDRHEVALHAVLFPIQHSHGSDGTSMLALAEFQVEADKRGTKILSRGFPVTPLSPKSPCKPVRLK
jgi:hypothetical protein